MQLDSSFMLIVANTLDYHLLRRNKVTCVTKIGSLFRTCQVLPLSSKIGPDLSRFKNFSHYNLIYKFLCFFLNQAGNCRVSLLIFCIIFSLNNLTYSWSNFVIFIGFQLTFLINCFDYLRFITHILFFRLFIFFSLSVNFFLSVIQFVKIVAFFTPYKTYLHILVKLVHSDKV